MNHRWSHAPLWAFLLLATVPQIADAQEIVNPLTKTTTTIKSEVRAIIIPPPTITRPDPAGCAFRWQATVRNDTGATQDGLTLQGYTNRNGWVENSASGSSLPTLAPGASATESLTFTPFTPYTMTYGRAATDLK